MNHEIMQPAQDKESQNERGEKSGHDRIKDLLDKLHLSDTIKKNITRSIVGALALGAAENVSDNDISRAMPDRSESMNAAEWIIPQEVRDPADALRSNMIKVNKRFFEGVYDEMNIPAENISRRAYSSVYVEGVNGKKRLTQENNDAIAASGTNMCIASHDTLGVAISGENEWHGFTKDVRMSAVGESIGIEPDGDAKTFMAEGYTPEEALFQAFEHAASMKNGIHIHAEDELNSSPDSETTKEYVSSSYNLCIDSYEVGEIIQKDGMYKVDVEIVYGIVTQ